MDDDDVQETGVLGGDNTTTSTSATATSTTETNPTKGNTPVPATVEDEETVPAKPPRPVSEAQKNELILKEAFPSVDTGVIKAVLSASGGRAEPAFNALLGTPQHRHAFYVLVADSML
jgi:hypothetical protein